MIYKILWTPEAEKDLAYWKTKYKNKISRIIALIENIKVSPQEGIGKPERLKYQDRNIWSRRIDQKNRLVYLINDKEIFILQCRFHYRNH